MLALLQAFPEPPWYFLVFFALIGVVLLVTGLRDFRAGTTTEGAERAAARALRGEEQKVYTGGMAKLISGVRVAAGVAVLAYVAFQLLR